MPERFTVTWTIEVDAESPIGAAREALRCQRDWCNGATRFRVRSESGGTQQENEIDLGYDNPLGRPAVAIADDEVRCGHCGSSLTEYLEDTGRHAPLFARSGIVYADLSQRQVYEDGDDERVICGACHRESELPESFQWA